MKSVIILLLAVLWPHATCAADLEEGTAFVIDGDTIEINEERIRLWGIDAPEMASVAQRMGTFTLAASMHHARSGSESGVRR